jgi:GMP synthase-like glutamine amidotransferase
MRAHCLQHVPFEPPASIGSWLADAGWQLTTTRFYAGDPLPAVSDIDLLVVMGGPMSANDDERLPWIRGERRFVREAIDAGRAVLGVCLGAQLVARAMGARVYPNAEREIGWLPIEGVSESADAPAWAAAGLQTAVFHWHGETFDLPPGAVHMARSAGCENQAFRIGERVMGLQFHLEVTPAAVQVMVAHGRAELTPSRYTQSEASILAVDPSQYAATNALMSETLAILTRGLAADRVRGDRAPAAARPQGMAS